MGVKKPVERFQKTEDEIEKLISKGALVSEDIKVIAENADNKKKEYSYLNFRIPTDMLKKVDEALKERVGISRNGWILEAIHEKLKKQNS